MYKLNFPIFFLESTQNILDASNGRAIKVSIDSTAPSKRPNYQATDDDDDDDGTGVVIPPVVRSSYCGFMGPNDEIRLTKGLLSLCDWSVHVLTCNAQDSCWRFATQPVSVVLER